jgi:Domain of unknown function (DUF4398)
MTLRKTILTLAPLLLGVACASTTAPTSSQHSDSSSGAIRAAEEVGASRSPTAALHLQLAKEQFEQARKLTNPEERERADRLLMRAQADAELSLVLARSESDKVEAQRAIDKVKTLEPPTTVQ